MDRYEILILTIPEITKDEELAIEKGIEKLLNENKGSMISFERWGKYQLAYPVRSNDYGVYFLTRFEIDATGDVLKEIRNIFYIKFSEFVSRHVITRLADGQSLEYKKPQSLEDAPKKHTSLFDKKDSRGGYGQSRNFDNDESEDSSDNSEVNLSERDMSSSARVDLVAGAQEKSEDASVEELNIDNQVQN